MAYNKFILQAIVQRNFRKDVQQDSLRDSIINVSIREHGITDTHLEHAICTAEFLQILAFAVGKYRYIQNIVTEVLAIHLIFPIRFRQVHLVDGIVDFVQQC